MLSFGTISIRRAATAALAGAMMMSLLPAATIGAYSQPPDAIKAAELTVLTEMNRVRARHGLAPLRMAGGVRVVARERSRSMRNQRYFAHVSPSGVNAARLLNRHGVRYAFWGENIGWTKYMGLQDGAKWMVDWWKNSPPHRRNMLNRSFNYVGIGMARIGAKTLYTIVFVNQRDHTAPKGKVISAYANVSSSAVGSGATVTVKWWGMDPRLSTRTAGLKGFIVQYKEKGDRHWTRIRKNTTDRQLTKYLSRGTHKFRVRARDNQGNRGSWKRPTVVRIY